MNQSNLYEYDGGFANKTQLWKSLYSIRKYNFFLPCEFCDEPLTNIFERNLFHNIRIGTFFYPNAAM